MDTDIEKIIKERAEKLPTEVIEAIRSVPLIEKIKKIARNNKLDKEKSELFTTETVLVVLGMTSPKTYPISLAENVGLDDNLVIKIAKEVDEQIIKPIVGALNKKNSQQETKISTPTGNWKNKVSEIAKKYSLNQSQTDKLVNTVTSVIYESKKSDSLVEIIIKDLGISRLLAEQIVSDLETRVFEYALKEVKSEKLKVESKPLVSKTVFDTKIPEVKPANLPMIEPGEIAHSNPPPRYIPTSEYKPSSIFQENKTQNKPEQVQQPVPVPRFAGNSTIEEKKIEDSRPADSVNQPRSNMIDNKLKNIVKEMKVEVPKSGPPEKYTTDPYREPLG